MKHLNLKTLAFILLITFISIKCSDHCDDEDLRRDQKQTLVVQQTDTLQVIND
ncbi:hypothetical protein [Flavobacterium sp. N1736]|uniref:hypothetical protein n=1 Tax=Flavobacterium sp. N1736 TaxID=2986823 RepID=UPI0022254DD8|nr:hypothetical protein [Flavobacterium sp. N1736]